ncbi:MAG TPA: HAMP domain-containing sensor histidine kinase [Myxococcales bacterium]|jgi:signal transduction histidine kinase
MSLRFLSSVRPAPEGFEACVLTKRHLLGGGPLALYAQSEEEVFRVLPDARERLEGVLITTARRVTQVRLGRLFWHLCAPVEALPSLRSMLELALGAIETAGQLREKSVETDCLVSRLQQDLQNTRGDYTRVTGTLLHELGRSKAFAADSQRAAAAAGFVAEASRILTESLDYHDTLGRLARHAIPFLADWCVVDVVEDQRLRRVAGSHADPGKAWLLEELASRVASGPAVYPGARAVESKKTVRLPEMTEEVIRAHASDGRVVEIVGRLGTRSLIAVPMIVHGHALGAITLASGRAESASDDRRVGLAEEVARRAALAVENARLFLQAQEAVRLRDEFLSVASHELRTPVTSLLLTVQGLRRGAERLPPARLTSVWELLERECARLAGLIDQMFTVGRIHLDNLGLQLGAVDLAALVRSVADRLGPVFSGAGCEVTLRAPPSLSGRWDAAKLEHVVTSILANAVKFGAGRPIEIGVDLADGGARLWVTDHGIGIASQDLPHVFEKFSRAVSARSYGGLGLGLYIAHHLVESQGGTIRAESEPGRFTTFTVELPLQGTSAA